MTWRILNWSMQESAREFVRGLAEAAASNPVRSSELTCSAEQPLPDPKRLARMGLFASRQRVSGSVVFLFACSGLPGPRLFSLTYDSLCHSTYASGSCAFMQSKLVRSSVL